MEVAKSKGEAPMLDLTNMQEWKVCQAAYTVLQLIVAGALGLIRSCAYTAAPLPVASR
jgi:hypothetical protein